MPASFAKGLDTRDYELIDLMDKMNQDVILEEIFREANEARRVLRQSIR